MRVMDLGDLRSLNLAMPQPMSGPLGDAAYRLLAYMVWPDKEARRRQYLATEGARALDGIRDSLPEDLGLCLLPGVDWEDLRRVQTDFISARYFFPHGGFGAVAAAPGIEGLQREIQAGLAACIAVGKIFTAARSIADFHSDMRGGTGIKKAVGILDAIDSGSGKRTVLMKAWRTHHSVAHLAATYVWAMAIAKAPDTPIEDRSGRFFFFEALGVTLARALDHQIFGRSYIPHGQNRPMLSGDVWSIPDGLRLPKIQRTPLPLPPDMTKALQQYRSPA